jgi:hypothetical protein
METGGVSFNMSWLTEWKAISAQIQGLLEASRFYVDSLQALFQKSESMRDFASVGGREVKPHIKKICDTLEKFRDTHKASIPIEAAKSLDAVLNKIKNGFPELATDAFKDAFKYVHVMVTLLVSFRAEFEYLLSDTAAVAMRLSERAFEHLQRSIVADSEFRRKWIKAFKKDEPACEELGSVHLLLHGIWAFKVGTAGERTDLVINEPIVELSSVERIAEALVLTEWKRVQSPNKTEAMARKAREQAARYTVGALGGVELAGYRFIVLVSKEHLTLPEDHSENGIVYRHINIAVSPKSPSKG